GICAIFGIITTVVALKTHKYLDDRTQHGLLASWQLPPDLFERQFQLTSLFVTRSHITDFGWLRSSTIHQLSIKGVTAKSFDGIQNAIGIQELTLDVGDCENDLSFARIADLPQLTDLSIQHLGRCKAPDISRVAHLSQLRKLRLDLTGY